MDELSFQHPLQMNSIHNIRCASQPSRDGQLQEIEELDAAVRQVEASGIDEEGKVRS